MYVHGYVFIMHNAVATNLPLQSITCFCLCYKVILDAPTYIVRLVTYNERAICY